MSNDISLEVIDFFQLSKTNVKKCQKIVTKNVWVITASYGARVHGSVFKIKFKALAEEFESIETFPLSRICPSSKRKLGLK